MEFKNFINKSLRELNNENIIDVDNEKVKLKNLGLKYENTKIPDFIIIKADSTFLVELKEIDEKEEDIKNKLKFLRREVVSFYLPAQLKKFRDIIKKSNNQFKVFVENNNHYFKKFPITILLLKCNRFMANFTIEDAEEYIHGDVVEEFNPFGENILEIENKVLIENKYTSTKIIGVWNGKDKFNLFNNSYSKNKNSNSFFVTTSDTNLFLLEDSLSKGIRIKKYKIVKYNGEEEVKYLVDNLFIDESRLSKRIKYLVDLNKRNIT